MRKAAVGILALGLCLWSRRAISQTFTSQVSSKESSAASEDRSTPQCAVPTLPGIPPIPAYHALPKGKKAKCTVIDYGSETATLTAKAGALYRSQMEDYDKTTAELKAANGKNCSGIMSAYKAREKKNYAEFKKAQRAEVDAFDRSCGTL
jgi:hypothetical protein